MYGCESWTVKKAGRQSIDAFELCKTPESGDSKEIEPVNRKGNQPWILIGRTDAETHLKPDETPVFWSSDTNQLIGKVPDAGKDWVQKEKRTSEDKMARWHHRWNGHELWQTLGDGEGQEGLACCSPWGCKELDMTGLLNKNNNKLWWITFIIIYLLLLFSCPVVSNSLWPHGL